MKGIINGLIWQEGIWLKDYALLFEEQIEAIVPLKSVEMSKVDWFDAKGQLIVPGFIDIHIHGYKGYDVMDGSEESLTEIRKSLPENGITAFLPTSMTMDASKITDVMERVREEQKKQGIGSQILGLHMEGPFINGDYKGAQNAEYIMAPKEEWLKEFADVIKVITLAPEVPGAMDLLEKYRDDFCFSIGHSGASYEQAMEAFKKGAKGVTHLFNAMTGLNHRAPGIVGAALNSLCYCEMIADNVHIHPALYQTVVRMKGADKILLITDCMKGGGLPDGIYDLGGQEVIVDHGKCTLKDGTIAGSVLRLNQGARHFSQSDGLKLETVLPMITENPAKYLGIESEKGTLVQGKDADIVIMDRDWRIKRVFVKGNVAFEEQL